MNFSRKNLVFALFAVGCFALFALIGSIDHATGQTAAPVADLPSHIWSNFVGSPGTPLTIVKTGTSALTSGSATITTPLVSASSSIFYGLTGSSTTPLYTSAIVSGTSFTVVGTGSTTFSYMVINH